VHLFGLFDNGEHVGHRVPAPSFIHAKFGQLFLRRIQQRVTRHRKHPADKRPGFAVHIIIEAGAQLLHEPIDQLVIEFALVDIAVEQVDHIADAVAGDGANAVILF